MPEDLEARRPPAGSAFRRAGATVAVACAVTGSLIGLGSIWALAAPERTSAHGSVGAPAPTVTPTPKVRYADADLAAFAASPYAGDALDLAVIWGTPDVATAKGKAGGKLRTGVDLPVEPGRAGEYPFTPDQQQHAFFLGSGDFRQALGLAVVWGESDVYTAKTTIGAKMLAGLPLPEAPTSFTADQEVAAFTASGYDQDDAARLAALWQSPSTWSAEARAGRALLAGESLPV